MQTVAKFEGVNGTFVIRKKEHPFPLFQKLWLEFWAKDKEPVLTFLPYIQEFPRKDYTSFLVFYDPERDLIKTVEDTGITLNELLKN